MIPQAHFVRAGFMLHCSKAIPEHLTLASSKHLAADLYVYVLWDFQKELSKANKIIEQHTSKTAAINDQFHSEIDRLTEKMEKTEKNIKNLSEVETVNARLNLELTEFQVCVRVNKLKELRNTCFTV